VQDTWKITPKLTMDYGLRMYKWGQNKQAGGEASAFALERFDPTWGGNPPVFFRPVLQGTARRAQNPRTGEILPATFIGLIVPGTGFNCSEVLTAQNPCEINGIVTQRDGNYLESGGEGFIEPLPIQFDPRVGIAWAPNPRTVIRVAGGSFHDGTGGPTNKGGPAYQFDRTVFFTDFDNYLTGSSGTSPVPNVSGYVRDQNKRPNNVRFTTAIQREVGKNVVVDAAYVGSRTYHVGRDENLNQIPFGRRYDPAFRDTTVAQNLATGTPGSLSDPYLRPILGFGDINIQHPIGWQTYDSFQLQVTRRFTGRFEMAGSYTWARGEEDDQFQNNPLPTTTVRRDLQEHVFVTSYQYEIPRASSLFGGNKVVGYVLDNWRISGISTFGTGGRGNINEVSYSPSFDFSGGGENCGNYKVVGDPSLSHANREIDQWFNTAAFAPLSGRGDYNTNCQPWKFSMPGWHNHDLTFFKDIRLKGNQQLQYRWEIYNLFDQVQFQDVNRDLAFNPTTGAQTNTTFGKVTSARTERRMQMSIRYIF
jgi:hypothetical protein